jgi:putative toxin-antitoxin system antitoxin component (TIGR02293 family)
MWHNVHVTTSVESAVSTTHQLAEYLREWLGPRVGSDLPLTTVARMTRHGLTRDEVHSLVIHRRTFKHRKSNKQKLSQEESDRAIRTARLLARAQASLGDSAAALQWMRQPKTRFEGRTPLQMMVTETGGRLVEEMLLQIDEGMFA